MPTQAHPRKVLRYKASITRILAVSGLAITAGALQIYLANIPRTINLPQDELAHLITARADNERIEIDNPNLAEGELLLSYSGQTGEVVDLHFENAIVDSSNNRLQPSLSLVKPVPAAIAYVSSPAPSASSGAAIPTTGGDTCHTFVEVRRAKGAQPITSFNVFLLNGSTDNEQRRELRSWIEGGALDVEIHTDPPPSPAGSDAQRDLPGCDKTLQVRPLENNDPSANVDAPLINLPVRLLVPELKIQKSSSPANAFRIRITPAFDNPLKWRSADDLFTEISLGEKPLESRQVRVLPMYARDGERLKATAAGKAGLVLDQLGFTLNLLKLRIVGRSRVEVDGKPLGFNFMQFVKENPIPSGILAFVNGYILLLVKQTFFSRVEAGADES